MRHSTFKKGNEAVLKAGQHAYKDRRRKKRLFRVLWIARLNAAVRERGLNYSRFVQALHAKKIVLNRKTLSELAIREPEVFDVVMKAVK